MVQELSESRGGRPRLSFLFKSCGLWTLSCDFVPHNYETLKWLSSPPILMQKSFWWWQCSDIHNLPLPPPPYPLPPISPSLISLMVSVDVKHHVYLINPFQRAWCKLHQSWKQRRRITKEDTSLSDLEGWQQSANCLLIRDDNLSALMSAW